MEVALEKNSRRTVRCVAINAATSVSDGEGPETVFVTDDIAPEVSVKLHNAGNSSAPVSTLLDVSQLSFATTILAFSSLAPPGCDSSDAASSLTFQCSEPDCTMLLRLVALDMSGASPQILGTGGLQRSTITQTLTLPQLVSLAPEDFNHNTFLTVSCWLLLLLLQLCAVICISDLTCWL